MRNKLELLLLVGGFFLMVVLWADFIEEPEKLPRPPEVWCSYFVTQCEYFVYLTPNSRNF